MSYSIGITISDLETELQAMCPGNFSTSSRMIDYFLYQEVPHTPVPLNNLMQAGGPWNCPRASYSPFAVLVHQ